MSIITNRLTLSAMTSMNYLFLNVLNGNINDKYVNENLKDYLNALNNDSNILKDQAYIYVIKTEINNNGYFQKYNHEIKQIKPILKETIEKITQSNIKHYSQAYNFYLRCINLAVKPRYTEFNFCQACGGYLEKNHHINNMNEPPYYSCIVCSENYYDNPIVGVAVIHIKNNKILLGKRKSNYMNNKWCIPCGYLNTNEPVTQGAKREFKEETSLSINDIELFDVKTNQNNTVSVYYIAKNVTGELKANDDLSDAKYFNMDNLPDMAFNSDIDIINKIKK